MSVDQKKDRLIRFPAVILDKLFIADRKSLRVFCVIRLAAQVDYHRLQRAVRLSLDAEPILGCRFVEHFFRPYWERRVDLDGLQLCTLKTPRSREESDGALIDFMAMRISTTEDPFVHVLVLRETSDTLCVRMNHVMGDGIATKAYVELVARLYRKLGDDVRFYPEPNPSTRRDFEQLFHRYGLAGRLGLMVKFIKQLIRARKPNKWRLLESSGKREAAPRLVARTIPAERMEAVDRYCRQHKATSNEVLVAAMYLSLLRHVPPPVGSSPVILIPVDLRRYLKDRRLFASATLVSVIPLRLSATASAGLDEIVALVRETLFTQAINTDGCLACIPMILDFPPLRQLHAMIPFGIMKAIARRTGRNTPGWVIRRGVALSNVGEINPESVRFDDIRVIEAFLTGAGVAAYILVASRFNGALTLSYLIDESIVDPDLITRILDTMVDNMPA